MAYRKTYEGLTANMSRSIELPIYLLMDTHSNQSDDFNRYLEIFTRNTDLHRQSGDKCRFSYETDKNYIIQIIIWMSFSRGFREEYPNNYIELCPRFDTKFSGPRQIKIDVMARFNPGDSIEEFEDYLKEFYHIDKISEGG